MNSAKQFNGLAFNVRDTVQNVCHIVICAVCADRTGRETGETGFAAFHIECGRLAGGNSLDRTDAKTSRAIRQLILRVQAAFSV
jgi:hypothetical protein